MAVLGIRVTIRGLRDTKGRFSRVDKVISDKKRQEVKQFIPTYISILKQHAPVKSGTFRESFYGKSFGDNSKETTVRFYSRDPKAPFVIGPTSPHTIQAVRAKKLRFWVGESKVFAIAVRHPGTKEATFVEKSYIEGGQQFIRQMNKVSVRAKAYLTGKGGGSS